LMTERRMDKDTYRKITKRILDDAQFRHQFKKHPLETLSTIGIKPDEDIYKRFEGKTFSEATREPGQVAYMSVVHVTAAVGVYVVVNTASNTSGRNITRCSAEETICPEISI